VDAPALEPGGGGNAAVPPRRHACCVIPNFVQGWDFSLQVSLLSFCTHLPTRPSFSWFLRYRRVPRHRAATAHPRAPAHGLGWAVAARTPRVCAKGTTFLGRRARLVPSCRRTRGVSPVLNAVVRAAAAGPVGELTPTRTEHSQTRAVPLTHERTRTCIRPCVPFPRLGVVGHPSHTAGDSVSRRREPKSGQRPALFCV
jgi:hypothetical protein